MAEECKDPSKIFPKVLLTGLLVTGLIYILVSISAITLVPAAELGEGETPLLKVVSAGAPGFPLGIFGIITMFAVANSALINMLMASRLVYGMSREGVLPPILGRVHREPAHAVHRDRLHLAPGLRPDHLRRRGAGARRHDRTASSWRLHHRQRRGSRAAEGHGRPPALQEPRRSCRSSARSRAPSSSDPGPGAPRSSTRLPAFCSPSASCSGS